jgi:hypothetical protein
MEPLVTDQVASCSHVGKKAVAQITDYLKTEKM